jgi:hypothetical protein
MNMAQKIKEMMLNSAIESVIDRVAKELRAIALGNPVATRSKYRDGGSHSWDQASEDVREAWRDTAAEFLERVFGIKRDR